AAKPPCRWVSRADCASGWIASSARSRPCSIRSRSTSTSAACRSTRRCHRADASPSSSRGWRTTVVCRGVALQMPVVPRQITLVAIAQEARPGEPVVLPRIDDEFGRDTQRRQRLVHLFPAKDRHVEVVLPAEEERRRANPVGMEERIGELEPERRILPRRAKLVVVQEDVLIVAVQGNVIGAPGAADGSLEARIARDHVV